QAVAAREQAVTEKERADEQAAIAEEFAAFLNDDLLAQAAPEQGAERDLKLRTVLDRASKRLEGRVPNHPPLAAGHYTPPRPGVPVARRAPPGRVPRPPGVRTLPRQARAGGPADGRRHEQPRHRAVLPGEVGGRQEPPRPDDPARAEGVRPGGPDHPVLD